MSGWPLTWLSDTPGGTGAPTPTLRKGKQVVGLPGDIMGHTGQPFHCQIKVGVVGTVVVKYLSQVTPLRLGGLPCPHTLSLHSSSHSHPKTAAICSDITL